MVAYQMPLQHDQSVELSRKLYRKKILKPGRILHDGRWLEFSKSYFSDLIDSFKQGAFDAVPLVLANEQNDHNADPENVRGWVRGLELSSDGEGLDALVDANDDGAKLLADNPEIGVSASILESYERPDGSHFPKALRHVLATVDPKVTGLGPWSPAELSNPADAVVDLTSAHYEKEGDMPLSDEQLEALSKLNPDVIDKLVGLVAEPAPPTEETKPEEGEQLSDEEMAALIAQAEAAVEEPTEEPAQLSNSNGSSEITLANARIEAAEVELARTRSELGQQKAEREAAEWLKAGVPPVAVELAKPYLTGEQHAVNLSNGQKADAAKTIRDMLSALKGIVNLSSETYALPEPSDRARGIADYLKAADRSRV